MFEGLETLKKMEAAGSKSGATSGAWKISDCGAL